jgi:hypothetical protein
LYAPNLYVALIHYPVINKNGQVIASAVTNLDLHDISRISKTYGVKAFYVVTPLTDQKELVEKIRSHWTDGAGSQYNPMRHEALELIRVKDSLAEVLEHIRSTGKGIPKTVATCARRYEQNISHDEFRKLLAGTTDAYLLIFGTAWGLSESLIAEADYILEPIRGNTDYNHLPVRAAAAIILDRALGIENLGEN